MTPTPSLPCGKCRVPVNPRGCAKELREINNLKEI